jgi:nucleoside-diphosphate-sugar epimerase
VVQHLALSLPGPIVILGGGGFIGSNLARTLVAAGRDDVTVVDVEFPAFRRSALVGATLSRLDLTATQDTVAAMRGARTVFHLAADMGGVGYFHSDADLGASMRNGRITLNVLDVAATWGVERLFYASSACAYPVEFQQNPIVAPKLAESYLGMGTPDALYGAEKLHGLRLCSKVPGARVGVLHTVFGPLQEHEGRRMKFPAAVATKALAARTTGTLELWGDGRQLRSYCYVDDAVAQILAVTAAPDYWGPVNIGAPGAISCRDVAAICLARVGAPDTRIITNPAEPSGVLARDCSVNKYEEHYGPMPMRQYADGFGSFIDWLETL